MNERLENRSNRSKPWAIKKEIAKSDTVHDEHNVIFVTSKSSFLPEELERRLLRGYCEGEKLKSTSLHMY